MKSLEALSEDLGLVSEIENGFADSTNGLTSGLSREVNGQIGEP